jgi:hypothetical protein
MSIRDIDLTLDFGPYECDLAIRYEDRPNLPVVTEVELLGARKDGFSILGDELESVRDDVDNYALAQGSDLKNAITDFIGMNTTASGEPIMKREASYIRVGHNLVRSEVEVKAEAPLTRTAAAGSKMKMKDEDVSSQIAAAQSFMEQAVASVKSAAESGDYRVFDIALRQSKYAQEAIKKLTEHYHPDARSADEAAAEPLAPGDAGLTEEIEGANPSPMTPAPAKSSLSMPMGTTGIDLF